MPERELKEIQASIKQDVADLVKVSAGLVTGFFSKGLCSLRTAKHKWQAFAREIGAAVEGLQQPAPVQAFEAAPPALTENAAPMVTVLASACPALPEGTRMTLYEANQLVRQLDERYRESGQNIPVTLQIDFLANGQPDRYQIAPSLGSGEGSILSHMKQNVARFLQNAQRTNEMFEDVPAQYRDTMRAQFTAFADRAAMHVSQKLIPYFETHCTLCAMRARRAPEIEAAPGMAAYAEAYYKQIDELCKTLNDSPLGEMEPEPVPPEKEEPPARSEAVEPGQPAPPEEAAPPPENKQSVRGWLAQCKQESRMESKDASRNKQDRQR